jgi:hypothetical protein
MSVTESFEKLKTGVDKANSAIKAAAAETEAELQTKVDEARRDADNRASELPASSGGASEAASHWQELQADWDSHIKRMRKNVDAARAVLDADVAEQDAEWAESNALDAIAFAQSAIVEAEYATLDAVLARKKATERISASS